MQIPALKMGTEKILNKISLNYRIFCLFITIFIFFIYIFFSTKVLSLPLDFITLSSVSITSILIGSQLLGIKYFPYELKSKLLGLKPNLKENQHQIYLEFLEEKFQKSKKYYFVLILIVFPFILVEFIRFWRWKISVGPIPLYFSLFEPFNRWAIALDIFNNIIGYLMLFLFAKIVWIMINLNIIVYELNKNPYINIDIFNIDLTGLNPMRGFILIFITYYFIIIALLMLSIDSIGNLYSYESVFPYMVAFLGIILFISTKKTIKNLVNKHLKIELSRINEENKKIHNKILSISTDKINKEGLEKLSISLDLLEKEEIKIKQMLHKRVNFIELGKFISSFLIATAAFIKIVLDIL